MIPDLAQLSEWWKEALFGLIVIVAIAWGYLGREVEEDFDKKS